jgi:hypothetical protein
MSRQENWRRGTKESHRSQAWSFSSLARVPLRFVESVALSTFSICAEMARSFGSCCRVHEKLEELEDELQLRIRSCDRADLLFFSSSSALFAPGRDKRMRRFCECGAQDFPRCSLDEACHYMICDGPETLSWRCLDRRLLCSISALRFRFDSHAKGGTFENSGISVAAEVFEFSIKSDCSMTPTRAASNQP